jgi:hypothetical protein
MRYINILTAVCATWALFLLGPLGSNEAELGTEEGVNFQMAVDRSEFSPGDRVRVSFVVTNEGPATLFFSRHLNECGSPLGFADLKILDETGRDTRSFGCSDDIGPIKDEQVLNFVHNPESWIALKQREIYGGEAEFDLPRKKGVYELRAELIPTSFTDNQKQILSQNGIRVLLKPIVAPVVRIRVK